ANGSSGKKLAIAGPAAEILFRFAVALLHRVVEVVHAVVDRPCDGPLLVERGIKRRRSSLPAVAQGEDAGAELRELACSGQCNAAHFLCSLFFAECLDFAPVVLAAPLPAGPMLHLINPLGLHRFTNEVTGRNFTLDNAT